MYYSTDQGKTWEGPFSEQEIEALKEAGVLGPATIYQQNPSGAAAASPGAAVPPPCPNKEPAPQPAPAAETSKYLVMDNGQQSGPFSRQEITERLNNGSISNQALVWCEGMPSWVPVGQILSRKISMKNMAEQLEGFSFKAFFSQAFSHHSRQEIEELCSAGTPKYTPHLRDVYATWPAPWLFARLMLFCLVLFVGFNWAHGHFENSKLIPGLLFVGNFGIPFCLFILFFELNVRRDVSLYMCMKALIGGGLLSLIISLFLFETKIITGDGWHAGPIEESGKLLAAILIATPALRNGRILTGLLIGAAVGAGFGAFESAGYTLDVLVNAIWSNTIINVVNNTLTHVHGSPVSQEIVIDYLRNNYGDMLFYLRGGDFKSLMQTRALSAISGHVVYSAITAGAYWMACHYRLQHGQHHPNGGIDWGALVDIRFLQFALVAVGLHASWNTSLLAETLWLKTIIWAGIGWTVIMVLVGMGLRQVRMEKSKLN